ncbi:sugar porter family MFS transporter [Celerinatantimonas sp. MCCC 1A17872]|uniref:sugar porter family MFS transporter n=1 Tax=Celerinatantimonas sp. MCCC 1A17872 TaxID=3177514 RepID=UPI0038C2EE4F
MDRTRYNSIYVYWLCGVAALGGVMFGFSTGVIAGALDFIKAYFTLNSTETGWLVSSIFLGCIFGALIAGKLADKIGRKNTLLIATVGFILSTIGSTFATTFTLFSIARIIAGLAIGFTSTVAPMYMGEIAPSDIRGKSSGIWNLSLVGAQTAIFLINFLIARGMADSWLTDIGWRWMMGVQFVPVVLMLFGTLILPETPEFCLKKGRTELALKVLTKIYPNINQTEARELFTARINKEKAEGNQTISSLAFILKTPVLRYGLIVGCSIAALQQLTGASIVMYYAPVILQTGNASKEVILFQTIFIGLLNAIGAFAGMNLFDRFGRRPVMQFGTLGSVVSLLIISYSMYTHSTGYIAIFGALLFMVMFAISWGAGCWVLISEIFPARIKGFSMGLAVMLMWIVNFLVAQFFPMINDIPVLQEHFNGAFSMWIFAALNLFCLFFLTRYVPETKGVNLENIEQLLSDHIDHLSHKHDGGTIHHAK